jgi:hypothetical protein
MGSNLPERSGTPEIGDRREANSGERPAEVRRSSSEPDFCEISERSVLLFLDFRDD